MCFQFVHCFPLSMSSYSSSKIFKSYLLNMTSGLLQGQFLSIYFVPWSGSCLHTSLNALWFCCCCKLDVIKIESYCSTSRNHIPPISLCLLFVVVCLLETSLRQKPKVLSHHLWPPFFPCHTWWLFRYPWMDSCFWMSWSLSVWLPPEQEVGGDGGGCLLSCVAPFNATRATSASGDWHDGGQPLCLHLSNQNQQPLHKSLMLGQGPHCLLWLQQGAPGLCAWLSAMGLEDGQPEMMEINHNLPAKLSTGSCKSSVSTLFQNNSFKQFLAIQLSRWRDRFLVLPMPSLPWDDGPPINFWMQYCYYAFWKGFWLPQ